MELIAAIVTALELAIRAEPEAAAIVKAGKKFIKATFGAGVITKEQQNALHAHVDAYQTAILAGQTPPEFLVEPDPPQNA